MLNFPALTVVKCPLSSTILTPKVTKMSEKLFLLLEKQSTFCSVYVLIIVLSVCPVCLSHQSRHLIFLVNWLAHLFLWALLNLHNVYCYVCSLFFACFYFTLGWLRKYLWFWRLTLWLHFQPITFLSVTVWPSYFFSLRSLPVCGCFRTWKLILIWCP